MKEYQESCGDSNGTPSLNKPPPPPLKETCHTVEENIYQNKKAMKRLISLKITYPRLHPKKKKPPFPPQEVMTDQPDHDALQRILTKISCSSHLKSDI